VPLGKLTARDLDGLYAVLEAQGKASATIRRVHNVISGALAQAVRHGLLTVNVAKDADPQPVRTKPTRPPTTGELATLINATDEAFKAFLILAATTGARRGELGALRWRNVHLDAGTLTISASSATTAPCGPEARFSAHALSCHFKQGWHLGRFRSSPTGSRSGPRVTF